MLNWRVDHTDVWDNVRAYEAIFEEYVTEDINFYISFRVFVNNADEWQLGIIQTAPNRNAPFKTIKCYTPEVGKAMAEDELKKILKGMKKVLDKYKCL